MTATIKTQSQANVNTGTATDSLSRASLITMGAFSGFVGIWAAACFIGALFTNGPGQLIRGFFSALLG